MFPYIHNFQNKIIKDLSNVVISPHIYLNVRNGDFNKILDAALKCHSGYELFFITHRKTKTG